MTKERNNQRGPDWAAFQGYSTPSYTMVPDELFDEHLPFLSGAELKVLLYIIRRTFGFKRIAIASACRRCYTALQLVMAAS
jgi:hypothetical protein